METKTTEASGNWRKGEFVRWQDLFAPVEGFLVWLALASLSLAAAMAVNTRMVQSNASALHFVSMTGKDFTGKQIMLASMYLVVLFFLWRIARRVTESALVARYRSFGWTVFLPALFGGVLLALATTFATEELARHAVVTFHVTPAERQLMPQSYPNLPVALLSMALVAPFVEEFYFRGILLSWLSRNMFAPLAALISAAIFALLHFRFVLHPGADGWVYTGAIGIVGLVNAILALQSRSLWGPFAVHAGYNATLVSAVFWLPRFFG